MAERDDIERRLIELEIKASLADDLLERLDEIVVRQQAQIESLMRELGRLARERDPDEPSGFRSLRDEIPPHY